MAEYEPGGRNIGARVRRRRRWLGIVAFALAAAFAATIVYVDLPPILLLGTVAFLFPGFLGLLQDRTSFSAEFAVREQYDFSGSGGDSGEVRNKSAVPTDRVQAAKQVLAAILGALVVTGAVYAAALVLASS